MLTATSFVVFPRNLMGACWPPRLKAFFLDVKPMGTALHDRVCRLCSTLRSIMSRIEGRRSLAGSGAGVGAGGGPAWGVAV
jgi:hypothetical protein